jgi:hypothetical protein
MMYDENQVKSLLGEYIKQTEKNEKHMYDDEIRAEADLCHECCACCRIMV